MNDTFLTEGDVFYSRVLSEMKRARKEILINMYIFEQDQTGRAFAKVLKLKAAQGCSVVVIYDRIGSIGTYEIFWRPMVEAGVKILPYHRSPFKYDRQGQDVSFIKRFFIKLYLIFTRRNHRKLIIIDNEIAYSGGFNISNKNSRELFGEKRWLDCMFYTKQPKLVMAIRHQFLDAEKRCLSSFRDIQTFQRKKCHEATVVYFHQNSQITICQKPVFRVVKRLIKRSQQCVYLMYPYFIPTASYRRLLIKKAKQGVDVRVYLSQYSDSRWINETSFFTARKLLKHGVRVYIYQGDNASSRFNHAKCFLIDNWVSIGSANFDHRSFVLNLEHTVVLKNPIWQAEFTDFFEKVALHSIEADDKALKTTFRAKIMYSFRKFL